jgi:ankyrin repeat protein
MSAARGCRVKVVRLPLNAGADPTRTARKGNTALHLAVEETPSEPGRQAECVRLLLQNGADPNAENFLGVTPLMNASWFGCARSAEILLKAGADTSRKDSLGATAESMARQRGHDEVLRVLAPAQ